MEQLGSHWMDFHDILYLSIFRKSVEKIQVPLKSDKNDGALHEDQYTLLIICRSFLFRIKNISVKSCRETRNTHFIFDYVVFLSKFM